MKKIGKIFLKICTFVGAVVIISAIVSLINSRYFGQGSDIPENSALVINFSDNYSETSDDDLISEIMGKNSQSFISLIETIELASHDDRIKAIVARLDTTNLDLAQVYEVARVLQFFRQSGKKTYVYSQGFGPFGQGNREYFLASFFDKIYMQPHTHIGLTGISMEIPFVRGLLDEIGVEPQYYARKEYKSAMMSFTDKEISPEYKQNMLELSESLMTIMEFGITDNRQLKDDFISIMNRAPISAEEGLKLGLIDDLMYVTQFEQKLQEEGIWHYVTVAQYYGQIKHHSDDEYPLIAILQINGMIDTGQSSTDFDGEYITGSSDVLSDIAEIKDYPNLKALIVRINSPGGSYTAADEIYQALMQLKQERNIPIIISQGGYAASGGYYISLAGDHIVSNPMTITGSIGVLGGKFVLKNLWQKLGVNWANLKYGENSDILSINEPFSPKESEIFNASLDDIYEDFTAKVKERRNLHKPIEKVAGGKVWVGALAVSSGLVDTLGGYKDALHVAKEMGNIPSNGDFAISTWPRRKSFSEKIGELLTGTQIRAAQIAAVSGVDIRYLKLFKRLQYDTVLLPFNINM